MRKKIRFYSGFLFLFSALMLNTNNSNASVTIKSPKSYVEYCNTYKQYDIACQGPLEPKKIVMNDDIRGYLNKVNRFVNSSITWKSEGKIGDKSLDQWNFIKDGGSGDCDEYVVTKLHYLLAAGFPREAMKMTIVYTKEREWHLILVVETTDGDYVLDNSHSRVERKEYHSFKWIAEERPGAGHWVGLRDNRLAPRKNDTQVAASK